MSFVMCIHLMTWMGNKRYTPPVSFSFFLRQAGYTLQGFCKYFTRSGRYSNLPGTPTDMLRVVAQEGLGDEGSIFGLHLFLDEFMGEVELLELADFPAAG